MTLITESLSLLHWYSAIRIHQLSIDAKQIKPFSRLRQHIKNSRIDDCNHDSVIHCWSILWLCL